MPFARSLRYSTLPETYPPSLGRVCQKRSPASVFSIVQPRLHIFLDKNPNILVCEDSDKVYIDSCAIF